MQAAGALERRLARGARAARRAARASTCGPAAQPAARARRPPRARPCRRRRTTRSCRSAAAPGSRSSGPVDLDDVAPRGRPAGPAGAGASIRPSPCRKPSASSSSWPGVRIVTASALPSTRISSGSSTATSSLTPSSRTTLRAQAARVASIAPQSDALRAADRLRAMAARWNPSLWASRRPLGIGLQRPNNYWEVARAALRSRRHPIYAWRVLSRGVCDGCALGTRGLRDWTIDGVHLCNVRLRLLRLNTHGRARPGACSATSAALRERARPRAARARPPPPPDAAPPRRAAASRGSAGTRRSSSPATRIAAAAPDRVAAST